MTIFLFVFIQSFYTEILTDYSHEGGQLRLLLYTDAGLHFDNLQLVREVSEPIVLYTKAPAGG
jgi:hypothetical protein